MSPLPRPNPPTYPTASMLANGALFNISWLAIVYTHSSLWAAIIVALHLCLHFMITERGIVELRLIIGVTMMGALLDQALFAAGVFTVSGQLMFAPVWITCLWPIFATTLMHAFSGLQQHVLLGSAIGAIGGPASYLAGARLTDVSFASPLWGPFTMAIIWAILFPSLLLAASVMSQHTQTEQ